MTGFSDRKLFTPVQVGPLTQLHRVVMAPLTRSRSELPGDIPGNLTLEYYTQRASEGGLIISEATAVSITGRGWFGAPGIAFYDGIKHKPDTTFDGKADLIADKEPHFHRGNFCSVIRGSAWRG